MKWHTLPRRRITMAISAHRSSRAQIRHPAAKPKRLLRAAHARRGVHSAFELAALTALNSQPSPHAFEFHAGVLTFARQPGNGMPRRVSVPSRILHFTEDPKAKLFRLHVAFLAFAEG